MARERSLTAVVYKRGRNGSDGLACVDVESVEDVLLLLQVPNLVYSFYRFRIFFSP